MNTLSSPRSTATLAWSLRLALPTPSPPQTTTLHPPCRKPAQIATAQGIATLGKALFAAKAEFLISFLSFEIRSSSASSSAATSCAAVTGAAFSAGPVFGRCGFYGDGFKDVAVVVAGGFVGFSHLAWVVAFAFCGGRKRSDMSV